MFWWRRKCSKRAILARALRPAIESLEIRRLFQSCSVSGGLMTVIGNETNDDITIAEDGSHRMLIRNHGVEINHTQCYVPDTIPQIYVDAYWGNDIITVLASVSAKIQMH